MPIFKKFTNIDFELIKTKCEYVMVETPRNKGV